MRTWQHGALAGLILSLGLIPLPAAAQVVDVQVAPGSVPLRVGDSTQVFATGYGQGGNVVVGPAFRWTSNDSSVVRVVTDPQAPDVATLVGVKAGSAVVEARVGTARGFTTVNVTGPVAAAPPPLAVAPAPTLADSVLPLSAASAVLRTVVRVDAQRGNASTLVIEPVGHRGFGFDPGQFGWIAIDRSPFSITQHPFSFSSAGDTAAGEGPKIVI